jgi:hypothetical protein
MAFDPFHPHPVPGMPNSSWLTVNQLASIGSVVAAWSWMDLAFEALLSTLIQTDDMLGQSLTEDLSPDYRIKAARRLVKTWETAIRAPNESQSGLFTEIREITKWIATNKGRRNQIAHWIWLRSDDENMFGWKHHVMFASENERPSGEITKTEIMEFSKEIGLIAGRLGAAELEARNLPTWPQPTHEPLPLPGLSSLLAPYKGRSV